MVSKFISGFEVGKRYRPRAVEAAWAWLPGQALYLPSLLAHVPRSYPSKATPVLFCPAGCQRVLVPMSHHPPRRQCRSWLVVVAPLPSMCSSPHSSLFLSSLVVVFGPSLSPALDTQTGSDVSLLCPLSHFLSHWCPSSSHEEERPKACLLLLWGPAGSEATSPGPTAGGAATSAACTLSLCHT